jgi:hypothetical protein
MEPIMRKPVPGIDACLLQCAQVAFSLLCFVAGPFVIVVATLAQGISKSALILWTVEQTLSMSFMIIIAWPRPVIPPELSLSLQTPLMENEEMMHLTDDINWQTNLKDVSL